MSDDIKLKWGCKPQLVFQSTNEYYRALGHLTNDQAYSISYEYNKKTGSYTDACRIHILSNATNIPEAFERKRTTLGRINCNEYVENLKEKHRFTLSGNVYTRNFNDVFSTVPQEYISDFLIGYNESSEKTNGTRACYTVESIRIEEMSLEKAAQPSRTKKEISSASKKRGKRDYFAQYIADFEIGEAGERLVYYYERDIIDKAKKQGKIDKSIHVQWISRDDDFAGYDILSYDVDKKEKSILR